MPVVVRSFEIQVKRGSTCDRRLRIGCGSSECSEAGVSESDADDDEEMMEEEVHKVNQVLTP